MVSAKQMWTLAYNSLRMVIVVFIAKKPILQIDTNATGPTITQSWKERLMQHFKQVMRVK